MKAGAPRSATVSCNAKVNLYLRVKHKRSDGFHEIETVFHSISLADTVTATAAGDSVTVAADDPLVPADASNLAARAAEAVRERARGLPDARGPRGVALEIAKRIPVAAGLGGGSADAAGALVAANSLGFGLQDGDLEALAAGLGSDVRFMLRGGAAIGRGRGEDLEFLEPLPAVPLVVVSPGISISTAWAYGSLKIPLTRPESRLSIVASALERGDVAGLCGLLENDFESLVFERYPEVKRIRDDLVRLGARGALLTGSGSSVYGVFPDQDGAQAAADVCSKQGLRVCVTGFAVRGVTAPK